MRALVKSVHLVLDFSEVRSSADVVISRGHNVVRDLAGVCEPARQHWLLRIGDLRPQISDNAVLLGVGVGCYPRPISILGLHPLDDTFLFRFGRSILDVSLVGSYAVRSRCGGGVGIVYVRIHVALGDVGDK